MSPSRICRCSPKLVAPSPTSRLHPAIEDADPLDRIEVVERDPPVAADHHALADLVRIGPTDVDMTELRARISQRDEANVLEPLPAHALR